MFCTRYDKRKQFRLKYFCTGKNKVIGDNEKQTELKNIHLVILRPLECLRTVRDGYVSAHVACHVGLLPHQSMVQLGLTTSMAGLAAGQLFFGPLSDKYGRRPVLSVALMLFHPQPVAFFPKTSCNSSPYASCRVYPVRAVSFSPVPLQPTNILPANWPVCWPS